MASIVDPKYRDKYKTNKDWLAALIDDNCVVANTKVKKTKNEDGSETEETVTLKSTSIDLDALFALAEANAIDVAKYKTQIDTHGAPGRLRMTIGNMLRSAAKKRHGLYVLDKAGDKSWVDADAAFIGDAEKTHNPDGSKIAKKKADAEPAPEEVEA